MPRIKKIFSKKLLYCIKLHDCGKLETREDTCSQAKQCKNYRLHGRPQERFGRLAGWLGPWESVNKITVQIAQGLAETLPETDENNSLQVEQQVTL